ncbi:MAG: NAD(P)/FAD-dependent oxidoreductase [Proteobacteria bacterium]|nr:NAD(P)/FAD-dependent oxidoreductase [Pseudomonadota bacterium]
MADRFDVVVLGAGNAGLGAAGVARAAGKSVAVVEDWDVGGTCPIRGCVPKKVLVAAAQALDHIERAKHHHITVGPAKLDWAKLIEREQGIVTGVSEEFERSLAQRGIVLVRGAAKFVGRTAIAVGDRRLDAGKIVIATGSKPRQLPIPGFEHTITSDDILTGTSQPESLVFIGGGVIALEFSHVYARAGTKVTILEALPRLLPPLDADLAEQVARETRRIGVEVVTGVKITGVAPSGARFAVEYEKDGTRHTVNAARVANGAGRVADVLRLELDAAGIKHDGPAIAVDDYLRSTSNPDVLVAGDALVGPPQLSPIATYAGRLAGRNAIGDAPAKADYWGIPSCVYTVPAVASVGLTEAKAREQGLKFAVKVNDMASWRSTRTYAESVAWAKTLIEDGTRRILGAHMIGHDAEEVIQMFAFAMRRGLGAEAIEDMVFAYPTFMSDSKFLI